MNPVSTSSILEIANRVNEALIKVDISKDYFGYTIAAITAILIVIVILFGTFQLISLKRGDEKRFGKLKDEIEKSNRDFIEKEFEKLNSRMEIKTNEITERIRKQGVLFEAEKSRALALLSSNSKLYNKAAYWWIKAARYFNSSKSHDFVSTALTAAQTNLKKITAEQIKHFRGDLPSINKNLAELDAEYSMEIKAIKEIIESKLKEL